MSKNLEEIDKNLKFLSTYLHEKPITPSLQASSKKIVSKINNSRRSQLFEKWTTIFGVLLLIMGMIILFFTKEEIRLSFLYFSRFIALSVTTKFAYFWINNSKK